jgi:hypothetical protein
VDTSEEPPSPGPEPTPAAEAPRVARAEPVLEADARPPEVSSAPPPKPEPAERPPAPPPVREVAEVASLRDLVLLPDFSGMRIEEVTRITENARLIVRVRGRGRAVRQDPPPGTVLPSGGIVTIDFDETTPADPGGAVSAIGGHS